MHKRMKVVTALLATACVWSAQALEETFTCAASGLQTAKKVFTKVTTLEQLKTLHLGGKMGGSAITGTKAYSRVVLASESASGLIYQFQLCDLTKSDDKHLKLAEVTFTVGEDGIYAQQTAQGYFNNAGDDPTKVGKILSGWTNYGIAQYSVVDLHVSDVDVATAEVDGETRSFGRLSEALSAAEVVTLTGNPVPAEGIMLTRAGNEIVYTGTDELELPVYFTTGNPAKIVEKRGAGPIKLMGSVPGSAPAGSFTKFVANEGMVTSAPGYSGTIIKVPTGATYSFVGQDSTDYNTVLELAGGTMSGSGSATNGGRIQFYNMTISADSTIDTSCEFYSLGSGYNSFSYNLNGYTLTKTGTGIYNFQTANFVGGGKIKIDEGAVRLRSISVPANKTLSVEVGPTGKLTYQNANGKTGTINGSLELTLSVGSVFRADIEMPLKKLTMVLDEEVMTTIPSNIRFLQGATLAISHVGELQLGTFRPTISEIEPGSLLDVTLTGEESAANKIMIPTTLTSLEDIWVRVGEDEFEAKLEDGNLVAEIVDPNKVVVESGETLTLTASDQFGEEKTIVVKAGGVLDVHGIYDTKFAIALDGGTLANTGADIPHFKIQTPRITLLADSEIYAEHDTGSINSSYSVHDINLNGHTLTKTGAGDLWLVKTRFVGGGKVKIAEGAVRFWHTLSFDGDAVLEIGEDGTAMFTDTNNYADSLATPSFSSIIGSGTLQTKNLPTASLAGETWTGTLALRGTDVSSANLSRLGNANSTLLFMGARLVDAANGTFPGTIEIMDSDDRDGLTFGDWGYGINYSFNKLTGNGRIATNGFSWYAYYGACKVADASEFKGSIAFANTQKGGMWLVAGAENPDYPSGNDNQPHAAIWVSSGATLGLGGSANSLNAVNTIKGTLKVWTADAALLETAVFVDGSAIDLSEAGSALALPETATGTTTILLGNRTDLVGRKIVSWTTQPEGFKAEVQKGSGYRVISKDDGLYVVKAGLSIQIK